MQSAGDVREKGPTATGAIPRWNRLPYDELRAETRAPAMPDPCLESRSRTSNPTKVAPLRQTAEDP